MKKYLLLPLLFFCFINSAFSNDGVLKNTNDAVQMTGTGKGSWMLKDYEDPSLSLTKMNKLPYQFFVPKLKSKNDKVPLVIFLHGSGEAGVDNKKQMFGFNEKYGPYFFSSTKSQLEYPCYVVAPQTSKKVRWVGTKREKVRFSKSKPTDSMLLLISLVKSILSDAEHGKNNIDVERVYVVGTSMGGLGTYYLAMSMPKTFAGIVTMSALSVLGGTQRIKHLAASFYHATGDTVVKWKNSEYMFYAFSHYGAKEPRLKGKLYNGGNHGTGWVQGFQEPDFRSWLFSWRNRNVDKFNTQHWEYKGDLK